MANGMYSKGLEAFLTGNVNWEADTIKAVLLDLDRYSPNLLSHQVLADIPSAARVSISPALTAKTATNGVADAGDVTFPSVSGPQSEGIALFKDTGNEATSTLICFIDTAGGLPVYPGGSDISVVWDNGLNKIFRL
jgi:hypothetical protein